jgi:hypothetical protein
MQGQAKRGWHIFGHTSFSVDKRSMTEIPPAVDTFTRLAKARPSPESIWLIGWSTNGGPTNESDWDFVVFADAAYFEMLKAGPNVGYET